MKGPVTQGFAARLLDRAAGLTGVLRPRIAPYFTATTATAAPLIEEQSIEQPTSPPTPQQRTAEEPAKATDTRPQRISAAPPRLENGQQAGEPRLMPAVTPDPQVQQTQPAIAVAPSPAPRSQPVSDAVPPVTQEAGKPASSRLPDGHDAIEPAQHASKLPATERQPAVPVPDLKSALAAAVARLTPRQEDDPEPGLMPKTQPERPVTATPPPGAPEAPAVRADDSVDGSAPLHIHIGEIVIAPDPQEQTASKAAVAPQRPEWQPMLSLDDYRDQRRKEGA